MSPEAVPKAWAAKSHHKAVSTAVAAQASNGAVSTAAAAEEDNEAALHGFYELLLMRPDDSLPYALIDPGGNGTAQGRLARAVPDHSLGFRAGLGYKPRDTGIDFSVAFSKFESNANADASKGTGELWVPLAPPNICSACKADTASAHDEFKYRVLDFEAGHGVELAPRASLRIFGGVRYAEIIRNLRLSYSGANFFAGDNPSNIRSKFIGLGPRLGVAGSCKLGRGFSLFADLGGSFLAGRYSSSYDLTIGAAFVQFSDGTRKLVPALETTAGVGYNVVTLKRTSIDASLGYRFESWRSLADHSLLSGETGGTTVLDRTVTDLTLDGVFLRLAARF